MLVAGRVAGADLTGYEHDEMNVFRTCCNSSRLCSMVVMLLKVRDQGVTVVELLLNMFVSMCPEHVQNNSPCKSRHRSGRDSRARQAGRFMRCQNPDHVVNMLYLLKLGCTFEQATKCYVACMRILTHSKQVQNSLGMITQCLRN